MKKLEGMKLNGKNIVVKSEDDFSATNIGEYGQMIFLHLTEELPDKLKEMKKAGTLVPFLKDMDNKCDFGKWNKLQRTGSSGRVFVCV